MAWLHSYQEIRDHPKTFRLARKLGVSRREAIGVLHLLWWWAMDYAPDGSLARYETEALADACLWEGDARLLVEALSEAGWLDHDEAAGYAIHDWAEYTGALMQSRANAREANTERMRRARAAHKLRTGTAVRESAGPRQDKTRQEEDKTREGVGVLLLKDSLPPHEEGPDWFKTLETLPGFETGWADAKDWLSKREISDERAEVTALALKSKWGGKSWKNTDVWATFQVWVKRPSLGNGREPDAKDRGDIGSQGTHESPFAQFSR